MQIHPIGEGPIPAHCYHLTTAGELGEVELELEQLPAPSSREEVRRRAEAWELLTQGQELLEAGGLLWIHRDRGLLLATGAAVVECPCRACQEASR